MLHEYIWKGLLTMSLSSKAMNDIRSLGKAWSPDKSYDKLVIQNINKLSNWERYYRIDVGFFQRAGQESECRSRSQPQVEANLKLF